jgi:hypothetical protein
MQFRDSIGVLLFCPELVQEIRKQAQGQPCRCIDQRQIHTMRLVPGVSVNAKHHGLVA